jgi:hypothetical protein
MTPGEVVCIINKKTIKMKSSGRIMMLFLFLFMAGSLIINAQKGMIKDSDKMGMLDDRMMHMKYMGIPCDSLKTNMRMNQMKMRRMHCPMCHAKHCLPCPRMGMHPGRAMRPGPGFRDDRPFNRPGFGPMAPELKRLESIPDLTDKQKKEIAILKQGYRNEVQKFREETATKMKNMRDAHRKKLMDLLTDEQKKYLEEQSVVRPK